MEVEKLSSIDSGSREEDDVLLPGFRFHPTDEELVGFYLRRKVEKRLISIELIKQIDIYKYDPWDLPKASNVGDKEWYFFCKRGRKYRNSVRPNRVTGSGSGFWKATGIDRPIYSPSGEARDCIGLKKSLVYYRGSAGKGTKTDWMMHEFRLPPQDAKTTKHLDDKSIAQEAEVWTLCRILKRNVSYKKCLPDWRDVSSSATTRRSNLVNGSSKAGSVESNNRHGNYIDFGAPIIRQNQQNKPIIANHMMNETNQFFASQWSSISQLDPSYASCSSSFTSPDEENQFLKHDDWGDELRSIVEFASDRFFM